MFGKKIKEKIANFQIDKTLYYLTSNNGKWLTFCLLKLEKLFLRKL